MDNNFKPAGDLSNENINSFKKPEDLVDYFKPAGDIDNFKKSKDAMTKEEVDNYLLTIVSGEKYGYESEMGILVGGASVIVSIDKLKEMVDEGYNIVSAKCLNVNPSMISVEYQCFKKVDSEKRGRF